MKEIKEIKEIKNEKVIHWKSVKGGEILSSLGVDPIKFLKKDNNLYFFETKNNGVVFIDHQMLERIIERYKDLKLDLSILLEAKNSFELKDLSGKPQFSTY